MRKRLPETSCHSGYQRRGKGGAVIIDDGTPARNHGGRTSIGHYIRFDAPVGSRSHGTESSILALLVDAAHSKNILGVGRKIDFLPHTHTIIAGRIHADDSLISTHRGRMGNQRRLTILFPVFVICICIIKIVVTQRGIDDVNSQTVGIFGSRSPVVFLGKTFRTLILAAHQHVLRLRSHAHIEIGSIGSHRGEHHRAMLHLLEDIIGLRNYEILQPSQFYPMQGRNPVHIHKTAIENGYHHSVAIESSLMNTLTA